MRQGSVEDQSVSSLDIVEFSEADIARFETIKSLNIARLYENEVFNIITTQIAKYFDAPIVLISLVDKDYQYFLSHHGLDIAGTNVNISFCRHTIKSCESYYTVTDATQADDFCDNPLVTGEPHIRSYRGHKLYYENDFSVGTIAVIDRKPSDDLTTEDIAYLSSMSELVVQCIKMGNDQSDLYDAKQVLIETKKELSEFTYRSSHDFRGPILSSLAILERLKCQLSDNDLERALASVQHVHKSLSGLNKMKNNVLSFYAMDVGANQKKATPINDLLQQALDEFNDHTYFEDLKIRVNNRFEDPPPRLNNYLLLIFENLIKNAYDFIDHGKEKSYLNIDLYTEDNLIFIEFEDNGLGIPVEYHNQVFKMFKKFHPHVNDGGGLGLYLSKKSAKALKGDIFYESTQYETTKFSVIIPLEEVSDENTEYFVN